MLFQKSLCIPGPAAAPVWRTTFGPSGLNLIRYRVDWNKYIWILDSCVTNNTREKDTERQRDSERLREIESSFFKQKSCIHNSLCPSVRP